MIDRVQPTCSATTIAGLSGVAANKFRTIDSKAANAVGACRRSYLGTPSRRGRTKTGQPDAIFTSGTAIRVPRVEGQHGPALLDNVELYTEGGTASIDPGADLRLSGSARSTLAFSVYAKGGVFAVAAPVDTITELDFADGTTLALRPGGSLDGSTTYAGDGVLDWTGGQVSGGASFDLTRVTVRGSDVKSVGSIGGASIVQMLSPATFADGTAAHHNLVDLNGNSMLTFEGAGIGHDVEPTDGDFADVSARLDVQGSFMLQGDVIYANRDSFRPRFGDVRDVVTADVSLDWRPGCEQTTGRASGIGPPRTRAQLSGRPSSVAPVARVDQQASASHSRGALRRGRVRR